MLERKKFVEINLNELEKLAELGERFMNHRLILKDAYGDYFRVRYHDDGRVEFLNRKGGQWHQIGKEENHVHFIKAILNTSKGGCKACKKRQNQTPTQE